jgi:pimeloyl-ACP methyl ester carboxylesterase
VKPARLGEVELSDGRRLGWAEWGPVQGSPVLLCHGAGTSRRLGFGADVLEELGIRLVSADRPGLGASDPAPGRTLLSWADDVLELAAARELESLAAVGYSQGAPFALACAAAGLLRRVAVVCGTDELAHPAFAQALDPHLKGLIEAVRSDRPRAEAELAAMTPARLSEMVLSSASGIDREVYEATEFGSAYRAALAEGFGQGPDGYVTDTILSLSPWPFDPAAIQVAVDLWYGGLDTSPVHSPDFGETLARRIPTAHRRFVPDGGGSLLWTHSREILAASTSPA